MLKSALHWLESKRRRAVIEAGGTDYIRWSRQPGWSIQWSDRAAAASAKIPPGATVLDIGCADMCLETVLPPGCAYIPCDCVQRDERTIVCDFNKDYPVIPAAVTVVCVLGVLEYLYKPAEFIGWLARSGRPVILSYCPADVPHPVDRGAQGWVNALTHADLLRMLEAGKLRVDDQTWLASHQILLTLSPV